MQRGTNFLRPKYLVALGALVALAFGLRLIWITAVPTIPTGDWYDLPFYHASAESIASGHGYTTGPPYEPAAAFPPGYSYFLAGIYKVVGPDFEQKVAAGRLANAILGAFVLVPLFFAARRISPIPGVGLVACGIVALMPSLIFWTSSIMSDTLFTFLSTCAILAVLWSRVSQSIDLRLCLVAGLLIGLCCLVRSEGLLLFPAAATWLAIGPPRLGRLVQGIAVTCVVGAAVVLPWTIRNATAIGGTPMLTTTAGANFRIGHAPYSSGRWAPTPDLAVYARGMSASERALSINREGFKRGFDYLVSHPIHEIELTARKLFWTWAPSMESISAAESLGETPTGAAQPLRLLVLIYGTAFGLVVAAGLVRFRREPELVALPIALIVLWSLLQIVFFGTPRHHLPVLLPMAIVAAHWLVDVASRLSMREPQPPAA